jgi:serine/threonine protein kinase
LIGRGSFSNQVYIIDFGLAKKYYDPRTLTHIPYNDKKSLTGTARYASVNSLRGIEQSRRDDMESLGFVWMYLLKGTLPWMGLNARDRKQKYQRICDVKAATSIESLCEEYPREFFEYFQEVRRLGFEEEPNYSKYRDSFFQLFNNLGFVWDGIYDWTEQSEVPDGRSDKKDSSRQVRYPLKRVTPETHRNRSATVTLHNTLFLSSGVQPIQKKKPLAVAPSIPNPYNEFISKQPSVSSRKNFEITTTRPRGLDATGGELPYERVKLQPIRRNRSAAPNRTYLFNRPRVQPTRRA